MPIPNEDALRQRYDSLLPGNPYTMTSDDDDEDVCEECGYWLGECICDDDSDEEEEDEDDD